MNERLRFYENEWNKERTARLAIEKEADSLRTELSETHRQFLSLKAKNEELQGLISVLREREQRNVRTIGQLEQTITSAKAKLEEHKHALGTPGFWLEMVELPLALELDDFNDLPEIAAGGERGDLTDWLITATALTEELATKFDPAKAEVARRRLIAHLVYLRWLEIHALEQ